MNELVSISRHDKRLLLKLCATSLPFKGVDVWNCYEFTWLNEQGRPEVACLRLDVPCESPYLLESKSLKLYLMSFSERRINSYDLLLKIKSDLTKAAGANVKCSLLPLSRNNLKLRRTFKAATSLDKLNIKCDRYEPDPSLLSTEKPLVKEALTSDLLKTNCPVTGQPDYASILIRYEGKKINRTGLLKYIVSYRNHAEFHEQSVERMFVDIQARCAPKKLTVYARYTRRGGIDINPFRTTQSRYTVDNTRLARQ